MNPRIHVLAGCAPTPLAHYLKALGVLRLVGEQKDAHARGCWRDESFRLITQLDRDELERFFLYEYKPTPLVAPWNGGSGFYPRDRKDGIESIAGSMAPRFSDYRSAIHTAKRLKGGLKRSPKKNEKNLLVQACRRMWRGQLLQWLEAALVLTDDGDPSYPSLLGTGGNDGRLDFTNNFMQRLAELFECNDAAGGPKPGCAELLRSALYGECVLGLQSAAVGQFLPGGAGGANNSVGFTGDSLLNPWDFVLMLEGAVLFTSAVTRRTATRSLPLASAPFAVVSSGTGYGSAVEGEKNRGEQWMPVWERPLVLAELSGLIAEARCQLKGQTAQRPVDVARAIARLCVARGISAFERYAYIERNGQANLATPLGRWRVPDGPQQHQRLTDQIAPWVDRLRRAGRDKGAPGSICRAARQCEEAIMACCRNGQDRSRWQELLIALGEAEDALCRSPSFTARKRLPPLAAFDQGLSAEWLEAANDQSVELRLALALAGQHGPQKNSSHSVVPDLGNPVRRHFLPLEARLTGAPNNWRPRRFHVLQDRLASDPAVVCFGRNLTDDAIALLRRRMVEARRDLEGAFPLVPIAGTEVGLSDIAAFLNGQTIDSRIVALARPLMALNWRRFQQSQDRLRKKLGYPSHGDDRESAGMLALYGLFRLCHHWDAVPVPIADNNPAGDDGACWGDVPIRLEPAILQHLAAGNLSQAVAIAVRRLKVSGLRPHVSHGVATPRWRKRLAASLVFPISRKSAARLAARLTRPTLGPSDLQATAPRV